MKRKLILLAILLAAISPLAGQTGGAADGSRKIDEAELRRRSFEKVWNTVNEKHYDKTFGGVDWKKMREIYEPKALAAPNSAQFHAVLRQMLAELKLSHFAVYSPQDAETAGRSGGVTGAEIKMIDGKAVIARIDAASPAEKAGLKKGFTIDKIDGLSVAELLAPLERSLAEKTQNDQVKSMYRERMLTARLGGEPGTVVKIDVVDARNAPQSFAVTRYEPKGEMSEAFGNFPAQKMSFEARRLENGVGYIRFNIWVIAQMPKIRQAVRDFSGAPGIIFDLRGNPGGIGGMAPGIAGLMLKEQASLGSMTGRETEQKFIVYPQADPFSGKIVILTDYGTGSTSEVFAAGLQDLGRARIVGEQSAGAVLPSIFDTLPTGAIFQYAISDYKSPKKVLIEGRGVTPDLEVRPTRESLLEGRDLPLEAAVKEIIDRPANK
jgi:carboxyl-terminal processing protease